MYRAFIADLKPLQSREDESDEEEEDLSLLNRYESLLLQYDPDFLPEHLYEATSSPTNTLMHLLARGQYPPYDPTDVAQMHQLHVNVERCRVGEVLFQPNIVGLDQASLIETTNDIVKSFDAEQRKNLIKVCYAFVLLLHAYGFWLTHVTLDCLYNGRLQSFARFP